VTDPIDDTLWCRNYTSARKFPRVLGRIAGYTLPFLLSMTQVGVLLGSFMVLSITFGLWGDVVPYSGAVLLGVPFGLAWAIRHLRIEGRSPIKTVFGVLALLVSPPGGMVHGRPRLGRRPSSRFTAHAWVIPAPVALAAGAAPVMATPVLAKVRTLPVRAAAPLGRPCGAWSALEEVA
jgi:conjugation transfer TcpE-like protein